MNYNLQSVYHDNYKLTNLLTKKKKIVWKKSSFNCFDSNSDLNFTSDGKYYKQNELVIITAAC